MGAVSHCSEGWDNYIKRRSQLIDFMWNTHSTSPEAFNDRPNTSHADVLKVLKELDL